MQRSISYLDIKGLTDEQVRAAREEKGENTLQFQEKNQFMLILKGIAQEPMIVLLLMASGVYLMSGNTSDAIFLGSAVLFVAAISFFQDWRSRNALSKLKQYTQPVCTVIRNGQTTEIISSELVPGDALIISEGTSISADGIIIRSNDFSVNESVMTGESMPVDKDAAPTNNEVYQGTTVATGLAVVEITATGNNTKLAKIGESLAGIKDEKTPLELQIGQFVRKMVIAGGFFFIIVWLINFLRSDNIVDSLLKALTLAMSILPEEIPVAFTTFMALGAWRLMKKGIIVKDMKTVETLGSASVICTDKTGTITKNKMSLASLYVFPDNRIYSNDFPAIDKTRDLLSYAMWASEPMPFDPMEIALHEAYLRSTDDDKRPYFEMVHEYPLDGRPPMMTHVFEDTSGQRIVAAKGAPEALIKNSDLTENDKTRIFEAINLLAAKGYRLLGVGSSEFKGSSFPEQQQDLKFSFKGLVAFYDPPKDNISDVLKEFYRAGIAVKIITGDNPLTTQAIARQVNFWGYDKCISGDELSKLEGADLDRKVSETNIFTRMFPEAKLRVINSLKAQGHVVAMTGDGVNDAPALKAAHIGISMGKKGTEIAKQAASMILIEDDLEKMVDAIRIGRKIYSNLKKAIQYIISIHIPIILIVFIPLVLGWAYPAIFSPLHVIFLELIMGPTCSIIYENEPEENTAMIQPPRRITETFFDLTELSRSVIQGLIITIGLLGIYQYSIFQDYSERETRTMVFSTLIAANVIMTLTNRSLYDSVFRTFSYPNKLLFYMVLATVIMTGLLIFVDPLSSLFELHPLSLKQLLLCASVGIFSVLWYEVVKSLRRRQIQRAQAITKP
ncbi:MAG: cation-translocating P-type ATPase [Bacteroidota bacterium]